MEALVAEGHRARAVPLRYQGLHGGGQALARAARQHDVEGAAPAQPAHHRQADLGGAAEQHHPGRLGDAQLLLGLLAGPLLGPLGGGAGGCLVGGPGEAHRPILLEPAPGWKGGPRAAWVRMGRCEGRTCR